MSKESVMTVTLDLPPDVEARLIAEAEHKGVPVSEVIKAHLSVAQPSDGALAEATSAERDGALDELLDSLDVPSGVREAAFHRENWYR